MSEQQQREPSQPGWTPIQDSKQAANVLVFVARALASPVEVFLRKRFGCRYFGVASLGGLVAVPMWMLFWPQDDPRPIMGFWLLYLVMQLRARLESMWMMHRGNIMHSRYNGSSRLARVFPKCSESTIKGGVEPAIVCIIGVLLMTVSEPLGSYLVVAGISLALTNSVIEAVDRVQAIEMHDAFIEQRALSERFRDLSNPHRR